MVFQASKFLMIGSGGPSKGRPILNNFPTTTFTGAARMVGFNAFYRKFWKDFKQYPELLAVTSIIATDVIGDRPSFFDKDGKALGITNLRRVKKFWRENRGKETAKAWLLDSLITGDGYLWMGSANPEEFNKAARNTLKEMYPGMGHKSRIALLMKAVQDEDIKRLKRFDYVPSSTVTIETDHYDVLRYIQNVNGKTEKFSTEEIIHMRYMTVDGNIYGFSPVEALSRELSLLYFVKGNMLAYLRNGGSPDKLFVLEEHKPGSPGYTRFEDQLRDFKHLENRHGNLLASGKVNVQNLSATPEDMEYERLALYVTSNIAYAFGIPVTRIPFLIGKSATSGDSGGMAESGYWNKISEIQDMMEDLMNSQMFNKLGFSIAFNRKYKQDEVRESQTTSVNFDSVTKAQSIFSSVGKKIKDERLIKMMNGDFTITQSDLDIAPKEEVDTGLNGQNRLDNDSVMKEPDNRKRADTKRNIANQSANKGLSA